MAKQDPLSMYPEELLVTIENDQGDVYYNAHKTPRDVMKAADIRDTYVCVYKRDRRLLVRANMMLVETPKETDDAKG